MATPEVGVVIACHTEDEWRKHFSHGVDSKKLSECWGLGLVEVDGIDPGPVVVDFTASWCGPCKIIAPVLADFAKKFVDVIFLKVDVDEVKKVAQEQKIEAMPTFLFFKDGQLVDKLVGAKKDDLQKLIEKHVATTSAAA
ncbi:hypothetical protein ACLOJK_020971 [Asimina triloba]